MAYGNLVSSGNRLAENALATLCDSFKEKLKCPSVGYPAIMKFALCMEKHGITRGLKNDSSIETALYMYSSVPTCPNSKHPQFGYLPIFWEENATFLVSLPGMFINIVIDKSLAPST